MAFIALLAGCGQDAPVRDSTGSPHYEVADWPNLPDGYALGQVVAVAVDSTDHVFVFHRAGADFKNSEIIDRPTVAVFDATSGELLDDWGAGLFIVPHGLAVDANDHLWATDVGANTVFELSNDGTVLRRLEGDER